MFSESDKITLTVFGKCCRWRQFQIRDHISCKIRNSGGFNVFVQKLKFQSHNPKFDNSQDDNSQKFVYNSRTIIQNSVEYTQ